MATGDDRAPGERAPAERAPAERPERIEAEHALVVRPLGASGGRRDGVRNLGRKGAIASRMARAGLPVPESWVIDASFYDELLERSLPPKHDLRTLIKLAGSEAGDQRCARAFEELMAAPLPERLTDAITAWCRQLSPAASRVAVRPSLTSGAELAGAATRYLHSHLVAAEPEAVCEAVRQAFASSVLSCAVSAYAEAGVRDVSLALLLQRSVEVEAVVWLTRTVSAREPAARHAWHLGTAEPGAGPWRRRALVLAPLEPPHVDEPSPEPPTAAIVRVAEHERELFVQAGAVAERELGHGAEVSVAVGASERGERPLSVLGAHESPRWLALRRGEESTAWAEVLAASAGGEPPSRLSLSLLERIATSGARAAFAALGCRGANAMRLIERRSGRLYVSLDALVEELSELPFSNAREVLRAVGTASAALLERVARGAAVRRRSRLRELFAGGSLVGLQLVLDRDVGAVERELQRDVRALSEMDLTLLPNDALATTLLSARTLLERVTELWARIAASAFAHQLAIRALVERRIPEAPPLMAALLCTGAAGTFTGSLTLAVARVADAFARDSAALACLRDGEPRSPRDLPDGAGRGALAELLATHGDVARGAFELARPRWSEDASEPLEMLRAWLARSPERSYRSLVEVAQQRVRALADAELARYEPEIGAGERRTLRLLVDRGRGLVRSRAAVDRLLFRTLAVVRQVALDVDRRLRRIDAAIPAKGVFHCTLEALAAGLRSGRPELRRVIAMRQVELERESREPCPPLSFLGSPPRGATPLLPATSHQGIGVSAGVVDGTARVIGGGLTSRVDPGDILVVSRLDPALAPLYALAGGVVSESAGALSPGAEALRELAVPGLASVEEAGLQIADGQRLRIDGERGQVWTL